MASVPPATPETATTQYQAQQARMGLLAALAVYESWQHLDVLDLPGSAGTWVDAIIAGLTPLRSQAAGYASGYLAKMRAISLEGAAAGFTPHEQGDLDLDRLRASLMITGPTALQRVLDRRSEAAREGKTLRAPDVRSQTTRPTVAKAGSTLLTPKPVARTSALLPPRQLAVIQADTVGVAIRHVRDGGRDTIADAIKRDPAVKAYYRRTADQPCYFCLMLASRGPVYVKESFDRSDIRFSGPGDAKVHDNCNCFLAPMYSRADPGFTTAQKADRLWRQIGDVSGKKAMNAFRRDYERLVREDQWSTWEG